MTKDDPADRVVGADRDAGKVAHAVVRGESVLVAGSLGSGKTHFLRSVSRVLEDAGERPAFLRPGPPLSGIPFAALETWTDERVASLRQPVTPGQQPLLVVIDDAQDLDPDSARFLAQAIYQRRAAAVIGLETPRARASHRPERSEAAGIVVDLWLRGVAQRLDLSELTQRDAEALMRLFPGTETLDQGARATAVGLADGSRTLLRELAAHAVAARTAGTDPLAALEDIHRHSRAGAAIAAHVADLDPDDRRTLAILHQLARVEYADATRLVPFAQIDALLSSGLIHEDGTIRRHLTANRALAREAENQLPREELDAVLDDAARRMLASDGAWWSEPLAAALASRWHESSDVPAEILHSSPQVRAAVAAAGARRANDAGLPTLAAAYTRMSTDVADEPALLIERMHAEELIRDVPSRVPSPDLAHLSGGDLRRLLQVRGGALADTEIHTLQRLSRTGAIDDATACEVDLALAGRSVMELDWAAGEAAARRAADRPHAHSGARLRAHVVVSMCAVERGSWADASEALRRGAAMIRDPATATHLGAAEGLLLLLGETNAAQAAALEIPRAQERLHDATVAASQEGRPLAMVLAGLGAALLHARAGRSAQALAELAAAVGRSAHLGVGPVGDSVQLSVARAVSLFDRARDARRIFDQVSARQADGPPLLRHDLALTESCILVGESRFEEALEPARRATAIAEESRSPMRRLRDYFQLVALGAGDDMTATRMARIAEDTDIEGAHVVADQAAAIIRGRRSLMRRTPLELLRMGAPWSEDGDSAGDGDASPAVAGVPATRERLGLTRREREIAELVAQGLGNQEIARRLFLSVRTVESHVYQARAKLGAASRAELGRRVAPAEPHRRDGTTALV